jgi:hypothetical protein
MQGDDLGRTVMEEHGELLAAVRGVEAFVESAPRATGDIARRLDELATLLHAHVVDEEKSALYLEYPQLYPSLGDELRRLRASHEPLIASLRELARACSSATALDLDAPLSIRIRTAIASLRQHEAAEADAIRRIRELERG